MCILGYIKSYLADIGIVIRRSPERIKAGKTRKFYGRVNTWALGSKSNLRKDLLACYKYGIDGYHIELAGWAASSVWQSPENLKRAKERYEWLVKQCRALGLYLFVSVVNDNIGLGKYGDSSPHLKDVYDKALDLIQFVKKQDRENIIVQPVAEIQTSAGRKYQNDCLAILGSKWETVFNGRGGKPDGLFGCTYKAKHLRSISKITPELSDSIISSDHSMLIQYLCYGLDGQMKPDRTKEYYSACKNSNVLACVFYHFKYNGHDKHGIKAFGKA